MNTEHEATAQGASPEIVPPGAQLSAARQQAGWTAERLAAELALPLERMHALERDEHDSFGGAVYVRGYLRRAAVLLGIPAADLIAAYDACYNTTRSAELTPMLPPGRLPGRGLGGWTGPAAGAMAIVVAVAATWWLTERGGEAGPVVEQAARNQPAGLEFNLPGDPQAGSGETAADTALDVGPRETIEDEVNGAAIERAAGSTSAPPSTEVLSAAPASASARAPASESGSGSGSGAGAGTGSTPMPSVTVPAPTVVAAVPEATALPPGTVDLRLEFTEDCWLEVTDALGRRLAYRLYHAGDVARLRGKAPATVFLGNAEGVRLTVDETSIPVRPARRDGTARLTVGGGAG